MSTVDAWEKEHQRRVWGTVHDPDVAHFCDKFLEQGRDICDRFETAILDLGCGVGAQSFYLASQGYCVTGIDASPTAIMRALRRRPHRQSYPSFQLGEMTSLVFSDHSFDAVVEVCSLQCLTKDQAVEALAEAARVLRPRGLLFSLTARHNSDPENNRVGYERNSTDEELIELYTKDFEIIHSRGREHIDGYNKTVSLMAIVAVKK